jgi:MOSC domain-containing protein YiiM
MSMAQGETIDLYAPTTLDTVLEVRSGKLKNLRGLRVQSGIDKTVCPGPVKVTYGGIEGDEHDYVFHGGRDKAIHGCLHTFPSFFS